MKPRNKMERRVVELAPTLPELTDEQQCKMLKFADPNRDEWSSWDVTIAQVCEEFQVFRLFRVCIKNGDRRYYSCSVNATHKQIYIWGEIYQIWFDPIKMKTAIYGLTQNMCSYRCRPAFQYRWYNGMAIRSDRKSYYYGTASGIYTCSDFFISDSWHWHILQRCGGNPPQCCETRDYLQAILTDQQAESDWKVSPQFFRIIQESRTDDMKNMLRTVMRICARNHYDPKDYNLYKDYVVLLRKLGLDYHNAHYACPESLIQAHAVYLHRANKKEEQERLQLRLEQLKREKQRATSYAKRIQLSHYQSAVYRVCKNADGKWDGWELVA